MKKIESIASWLTLAPLVFLTFLAAIFSAQSAPVLWQSMIVYCCLIINFWAGIQWGYAQNLDKKWAYVPSVTTLLIVAALLLMPQAPLYKIPFIMLTLCYSLLLDIYIISEHNAPFLTLRIQITCCALALLSIPLFSALFFPIYQYSLA